MIFLSQLPEIGIWPGDWAPVAVIDQMENVWPGHPAMG